MKATGGTGCGTATVPCQLPMERLTRGTLRLTACMVGLCPTLLVLPQTGEVCASALLLENAMAILGETQPTVHRLARSCVVQCFVDLQAKDV